MEFGWNLASTVAMFRWESAAATVGPEVAPACWIAANSTSAAMIAW